jgi:hypothetical protein
MSRIARILQRRALAAGAFAALLGATGSAFAHHATDSEVDKTHAMKLVGVISKIDWFNPHIYLYLDVKDDSGQVTTWQLESAPPAFWRQAKVTKQSFIGDGSPVTVIVNPGRRDPSQHLALFQRLTRADGTYIQADAFVAKPDTPVPAGGAPASK